jgi:hypothetical protein
VTFEKTCPKHVSVLTRAFMAITFAMTQGSAEERERVLDKLYERLKQNGFELSAPVPDGPRLYERWRRRV